MVIYVSHAIGSLVRHLNNTGSVGGVPASYVQGSWIDPFEQQVMVNRIQQAYGSDFSIGDRFPKIQIKSGIIDPEKLTWPKRGHTRKEVVPIQIFYYAKSGTLFQDVNGVDHKNEDHVRAYLEYISRGLSNVYALDFPTLHHITPGTISEIEIHPNMSDTFWGVLPIEVTLYNTGSGF